MKNVNLKEINEKDVIVEEEINKKRNGQERYNCRRRDK